MLKYYRLLPATLLLLAASLFSENPEQPKAKCSEYSGGFTTGLSLTSYAQAVVEVGYYGPKLLASLGVNFKHDRHYARFGTFRGDLVFCETSSVTTLVSHLGLRQPLYQNLSITAGAMGHVDILWAGRGTLWTVGGFTGLDYQLSEHFMLTSKICPYTYNRHQRTDSQHQSRHQIFNNGSIGLLYVY